MQIPRPNPFLLLFMASALVGCDLVGPFLTTGPASWGYVQEVWGGIGIKAFTVDEKNARVEFVLGVHPVAKHDSAICAADPEGRLDHNRILVRFSKKLCKTQDLLLTHVQIDRPPSGEYSVVYDDADAGYPVVGSVTVQ